MAEIKSEAELVKRILIDCTDGTTRLWRNNTGVLPDQRGIPVRFGLAPGSADIVGIKRVMITPDMVGQEVGVFVSLECKWGRAKISELQKDWQYMVEHLGGISKIVYSLEDAQSALE